MSAGNVPPDCAEFFRAASLAKLQEKRMMPVRGDDRPLLLCSHEGKVFALDNRCPHMGFPLSKGSVQEGILTCHWHHARFDLCSGCTFYLWADDAPAFEVRVNGEPVAQNSRHHGRLGCHIQLCAENQLIFDGRWAGASEPRDAPPQRA